MFSGSTASSRQQFLLSPFNLHWLVPTFLGAFPAPSEPLIAMLCLCYRSEKWYCISLTTWRVAFFGGCHWRTLQKPNLNELPSLTEFHSYSTPPRFSVLVFIYCINTVNIHVISLWDTCTHKNMTKHTHAHTHATTHAHTLALSHTYTYLYVYIYIYTWWG